jgi:Ala-tRNA(Pro) deacylase
MIPTDARSSLLARFASLGIPAPIVPYPAHTTAEEGKRLRGDIAGTFTKNLLLKDKKGRLFLIAFHEDRELDLKTLHTLIGANGRLGFAPADRMETLLGVSPGWLTPLGIVHDHDALVTVVVDAELLDAEQVNFHPLVQEESVGLSPDHLLAFIRSCGREPLVVNLGDRNAPRNPAQHADVKEAAPQ